MILCRGCPFIVMAEGSIDCYTTGKMEPQALKTKEVESWAKQFRIPVTQTSLDTSHLQPTINGDQGAISQPAGLFPSQQTQIEPQVGCFPTKQKWPTDSCTKRQESGTQTPDDQVRAGMYKNGHTIDPVR